MTCPRCGATMKVDSKVTIDGRPVTIYYCPKCGETAHR